MFRNLLLLFLAASLATVRAEYRVALLLGGKTELIAAELRKLDFRCETSANLNEKELRRAIEDWSSRTPTNSTALLYFGGEVTNEQYNGKRAACLMASNNRPVPIQLALESMRSRGGSRRNFLLSGGAPPLPFDEGLPEDCFVSFGKLPPVSGKGSVAISPPEKFVPGRKAGDEWVNPRGMVFCWCPPGNYLAGSPPDTPGRYPDEELREVVIADGFWIGKYELTEGQNLRSRDRRSLSTLKNDPVNMLHWDDGRGMLRRYTEAERKAGVLPAGWQYDLPSKEQWEYAARAGTTTPYYFGKDPALLPQHANFADKSYYDSGDIYSNSAHRTLDDGFVKLAPVGSLKPNPWGLHDVYGNVAEWCRDLDARGGGWVSLAENCRSAYRDFYSSRNEQNYLGYRLVIQPNLPEPRKK